jgi:hypothetical protein
MKQNPQTRPISVMSQVDQQFRRLLAANLTPGLVCCYVLGEPLSSTTLKGSKGYTSQLFQAWRVAFLQDAAELVWLNIASSPDYGAYYHELFLRDHKGSVFTLPPDSGIHCGPLWV